MPPGGSGYRNLTIPITELQHLLLQTFLLRFWFGTVRSSSGAAGAV
jgi:hypothetical protein